MLGYLYFRIAGEAYALVSIGLISFAAVAQFAPALLGRHVLARRHAGRCARRAARRLRRLGLHADAALGGQVRLDPGRVRRARPLRHRAAGARAAVRPRRARQPLAFAVLEPPGQRRALRRPVALAGALGPRGEPGAALRRRLRARAAVGRAGAGLLARPRPARRPDRRSRAACSAPTRAEQLFEEHARETGRGRGRRPGPGRAAGRSRRAAARRRRGQRVGAGHGRLGRAGGAAGDR